MGVQVCERSEQKKIELNANIQLVMNSSGTLFTDKIFSRTFPRHVSNSLTFPGFPDKWSPCFCYISKSTKHWIHV